MTKNKRDKLCAEGYKLYAEGYIHYINSNETFTTQENRVAYVYSKVSFPVRTAAQSCRCLEGRAKLHTRGSSFAEPDR